MKTLLFFIFILTTPIWAEYRVFQLRITQPQAENTQAPQPRFIQSTLDPWQYKEYYPLAPDEVIDYTETWMCPGRTDHHQDLCPNPNKAQIPDAPVSNQNTP